MKFAPGSLAQTSELFTIHTFMAQKGERIPGTLRKKSKTLEKMLVYTMRTCGPVRPARTEQWGSAHT